MLKLTGVQLHKLAGDVADLVNMAATWPMVSLFSLLPQAEI